MNEPYLQSLLGNNEKILLISRRHWLVLAGEILTESVLSLAIVVLISLIWALWLPNPLVLLGYLLLLLPLASLVRDVAIWFNRKYVITNRRVMHIQGVLNKDVIDSSLEKVTDVKMDQSVWGRLFGFGNVQILTASELGVNKLSQIANPVQFKTTMLNAKNRLEDAPAGPRQPNQPADVPALIAQLDTLRQNGVLTESEFAVKKAQLLSRL